MKPKFTRLCWTAPLLTICLGGFSHAATYTKADNIVQLDLGSSWGGTAPGAADIANWSGSYSNSGALSAPLPASALTWQGISVGTISGPAAGNVFVGGTGAPVAGTSLTLGTSGIQMGTASHDLILNAETIRLSGSQTWQIPAGRNLRFGSNANSSNVDGVESASSLLTLQGGGTVDANQGPANGFADYAGKWLIGPNTTLRGAGTGTSSWGSNTADDAITLQGGTLAVGTISGAFGSAVAWPQRITLAPSTNSTIASRHLGTGAPDLTLQGLISGSGNLTINKPDGAGFSLRLDNPNNSYSGNTTLVAGASGTLAVTAHTGTTAGTKTPLGTGDIHISGPTAASAALEFNTNGSSAVSGQVMTINNRIHLQNATLRTRQGNLTFNGDITLTGANIIQGQVDLRDITLNSLLAGSGSVNLRATGTQRIILPYPNDYTGGSILGNGSSNVGIIVLGDNAALGNGPITARGLQIHADLPNLTLSNPVSVGAGQGGGLCFGGSENISLTGPITVDDASRPFQNSGTGLVTLAGINLTAGTSAVASFNAASTTRGNFTVTGPITGPGRIEVRGGTIRLEGASTFTGSTAISSNGRLHLTGSLSSNITMTGASASLSGSGTTTGSLTTSGTAAGTILLDPDAPTAAVRAADVAINGATRVELLRPQPLGSTQYTVLRYTGSFTGLANLSSTASRGTFADDPVNKRVTFTATAGTRTWNNAALTGLWNSTDANWAEGDNRFFPGDAVVFSDTAPGTITIAGLVTPSLVTFHHSAGNDITLQSAANNQITGAANLVKTGTGTTTLLGPNAHTGKTTLSGGTLVIRTDASLGAVPAQRIDDQLILAGGTLRLAPLPAAAITLPQNRGITLAGGISTLDTTAVGNAATASIQGDILGPGGLIIFANGDTSLTGGGVPGATELRGLNDYEGDTTIKSGVVAIESYFGSAFSKVILDGGGLVDRNQNVNFPQDILVGPAGGILRSYGNATTTFSASFANAPGVASATLTHTDGGTQILTGDGSGFNGSYINARGIAFIDSDNWPQTTFVNTEGTELRFGSGGETRIRALNTDRNVFVEFGTRLNLVGGTFTATPGDAVDAFVVQGDGALTSSTGTLTFHFPTTFEGLSQSVSVAIEDPGNGTPLRVVKTGPGSINNFNQPNNYTGGTTIEAGRISAAHPDAFGWGAVEVQSGGQAYLYAPNGVYFNDMTLAGIGPAENAGNLGALRLEANAIVEGNVTIAPAGARIVTYNGATGSLAGWLQGGGNLEINSPTSLHNGTLINNARGASYTGTLTVAQGRLNHRTLEFGGSVVVADGASIADEGIIDGSLTLGATSGAPLRMDGASPFALSAGSLTTHGTIRVSLDTLPANQEPMPVVEFTTFNGSLNQFATAPSSLRRLAFAQTGNSITATVSSGTRTWTGTSNGNWDSAATNWQEGDQLFFPGDSVVFPSGAANRTITIPTAVTPASVLFNNETGSDYVVNGRMVVAAGGSFTKQGQGALALNGAASNIAVPMILNGGLVSVGTTNYTRAFGTCPHIIVQSGTLRLNGINQLYDGGGSHTVTVEAGAVCEINGFHNHFFTLNLNGGTIRGITSNDPGLRYNDEYSTFDVATNVGGTQMSTITRAPGGTGRYALNGAPFNVNDATQGTDLLVDAPLSGTSLIKNGTGTMALTQPNIYAGGTVINAGTLLANNINGSGTGAGAVLVQSGGTLGGTGSVTGSIQVAAGGALAPGDQGIESLATGNLQLLAGSTLQAELRSSGSPALDVTAVTGNLTLAGALNLTDISPTPAPIAAGTRLTLMTYTGTLTGTFTGLPEGASLTVGPNEFIIRYADAKKVTLEAAGAATGGFDAWALTITDPSKRGRNDDADGDGLSNLQEYLFGTNPNSQNGSPVSQQRSAGLLTLRWKQLASGGSYQLQESSTLLNGSWTNSAITPTTDGPPAGEYQAMKADVPATSGRRFFRVQGAEN